MLNRSQKQNFINGFVGSFIIQGILYVGNVNSGDLYNMLHLSFLIGVSMFFFGHEEEESVVPDIEPEVPSPVPSASSASEEEEESREDDVDEESKEEVVKKPIFVWMNDTVNHM